MNDVELKKLCDRKIEKTKEYMQAQQEDIAYSKGKIDMLDYVMSCMKSTPELLPSDKEVNNVDKSLLLVFDGCNKDTYDKEIVITIRTSKNDYYSLEIANEAARKIKLMLHDNISSGLIINLRKMI